MKQIKQLTLSIIPPLLVGALGSVATSSSVSTWYITLNKPNLNPPSWVFGPVWTTLYVLMGIAFYLIWRSHSSGKVEALQLFSIQLALNLLWSFVFFGAQSPAYAFLIIVILWLAIVITLIHFFHIKKLAAYLLVPYLLWVSFAAYLNYAIHALN